MDTRHQYVQPLWKYFILALTHHASTRLVGFSWIWHLWEQKFVTIMFHTASLPTMKESGLLAESMRLSCRCYFPSLNWQWRHDSVERANTNRVRNIKQFCGWRVHSPQYAGTPEVWHLYQFRLGKYFRSCVLQILVQTMIGYLLVDWQVQCTRSCIK